MTDLPSFVSLDFELANASHASICSVGLVRVVKGEVTSRRWWHVRPPAPYDFIAPFNSQFARLDRDKIEAGIPFAQMGPVLADGIGDGVVVGHNVKSADLSMFTQSWFASGLGAPSPAFRFVCTQALSRAMVLADHRLPTVYEAVTRSPMVDHHSPLADAQASAAIVLGLVPDQKTLMRLSAVRPGRTVQDIRPPTDTSGRYQLAALRT